MRVLSVLLLFTALLSNQLTGVGLRELRFDDPPTPAEMSVLQMPFTAQPTGDGLTDEQRATVARTISAYEAERLTVSPAFSITTPQTYALYPRAGNFFEDLTIYSFVDLDPGSDVLDWDCKRCTYDRHHGEDSPLESFHQQDIGVPVYAPLDGLVLHTHDGEPDHNSTNEDLIANFVLINHGNMQYSFFIHLKKDSIRVKMGDFVNAGTQIADVGSSGKSGGPHLHFEAQMASFVFEPFSGACRAGSSYWFKQAPVPKTLQVRDYYFTSGDNVSTESPRQRTFVIGTRGLNFLASTAGALATLPGRISIVRPDGAVAAATDAFINAGPCMGMNQIGFSANIVLNMPGAWHLLVEVENRRFLDAPFEVVASESEIVNRPPLPITAAVEPVDPTRHDVLVCRVQTPKVVKDPDYDLVRYRYEWKVNGNVVRDVTIAARSDAFPKWHTQPGDMVSWSVTPSDGRLTGEGAAGSVTIKAAVPAVTALVTEGKLLFVYGERFENGAKLFLNGEKQKVINLLESPGTILLAKKAGKRLRPGDRVVVRNPDGATSVEYVYSG